MAIVADPEQRTTVAVRDIRAEQPFAPPICIPIITSPGPMKPRQFLQPIGFGSGRSSLPHAGSPLADTPAGAERSTRAMATDKRPEASRGERRSAVPARSRCGLKHVELMSGARESGLLKGKGRAAARGLGDARA
jgi:hypothetical protein